MKLTKKQNCNRCKANIYTSQPHVETCELGFELHTDNYTGIPDEACYKPLTNADYLDARVLVGNSKRLI